MSKERQLGFNDQPHMEDFYPPQKPQPNQSFREMIEILGKMTIGGAGGHTEDSENRTLSHSPRKGLYHDPQVKKPEASILERWHALPFSYGICSVCPMAGKQDVRRASTGHLLCRMHFK